MLAITEIQEHLSHITSRPGWTITAYQGNFEGIHIRIIATDIEDSYHPGQYVDLGITSHLPPMLNTQQLDLWLEWRLGRIDNHETREWLKYDGKPIFDPHAPEADKDRRQDLEDVVK